MCKILDATENLALILVSSFLLPSGGRHLIIVLISFYVALRNGSDTRDLSQTRVAISMLEIHISRAPFIVSAPVELRSRSALSWQLWSYGRAQGLIAPIRSYTIDDEPSSSLRPEA